jgi:hypothetical protein
VDLRHEITHVGAEGVADLDNFDEIETPLTPLVFRYERLLAAQGPGQLDLSQPAAMSGSDEPFAQTECARAELRSGHSIGHTIVAGTLVADSGYPNLGYDRSS